MRLDLGRWLAAVRLHEFSADPELDDGWLRKRRTRLAEMIIPPGNLYLRAQHAPSEVLGCARWIAWECAIAKELKREVRITVDRRGLAFPILPGRALDELLRADRPATDKLQGIFLSASSLRNLHQATAFAFGQSDWPLSHGDATCRNVIVNTGTLAANWIDFDMRHRQHLCPLARRADDLRALLWSSAARLDPLIYRDCIHTACSGYADRDVTDEVRHLTINLTRPTVFQLAQAPISSANFACLRDAMSKHSSTSCE